MSIFAVQLKESLQMSLDWFCNSGVISPADASWGCAERIVLTENNSALSDTHAAFPAWTSHGTYEIIESRRADCNFQAALLFLLGEETFHNPDYGMIARNLLRYLYCRSGLLCRDTTKPYMQNATTHAPGVWNWSHTSWRNLVFFDDNAWACFLQLAMAERYSELDHEFDMKHWAMLLADNMAEVLPGYLSGVLNEDSIPYHRVWYGDVKSPHWGGLACMALARAYRENPKDLYLSSINTYFDYLSTHRNDFTSSEIGYALIAASVVRKYCNTPLSVELSGYFGNELLKKMGSNGNIPSEHAEAPVGKNLADTIYTLNWAVLGLQALSFFDPDFLEPAERLLSLLISIQDRSPEAHLHGCWRGMFDFETSQWGGGNCYEGGADSIYTGWTNAPIAWAVALSMKSSSLLDL